MSALREQRNDGSVDRRLTDRFPVNSGTSCPFISPVVDDFGAVKVLNVSMEGLSLRLTRRVEPGTLLAIHLENVEKGFARTLLVQVIQATPEHAGCVVSVVFLTPITYQDLTTLVL